MEPKKKSEAIICCPFSEIKLFIFVLRQIYAYTHLLTGVDFVRIIKRMSPMIIQLC